MSADPGEIAASFALQEYAARHGSGVEALVPLGLSAPIERSEPGEQEIAHPLASLGDSWRILNQIPVSGHGSDIDQVAIGLGGVFAIHANGIPDASAWLVGDRIRVSRATQLHLHSVRQNVRRAARLLSSAAGFAVEVRGVVAVLGAQHPVSVSGGLRGGAVDIVPRAQVAGFLRAQAPSVDPTTADRIYEVARHLSTWQPGNVRKDDFWSGR